jgi:quinol monooxygenase YgiN
MIVVSGVVEVAPESREQVLDAIIDLARASRAEKGCRCYAFYEDLERPNRFRVFEEWVDDAALEQHFATPHMNAFRQRLVGVVIVSRSVHRYEVASAQEL